MPTKTLIGNGGRPITAGRRPRGRDTSFENVRAAVPELGKHFSHIVAHGYDCWTNINCPSGTASFNGRITGNNCEGCPMRRQRRRVIRLTYDEPLSWAFFSGRSYLRRTPIEYGCIKITVEGYVVALYCPHYNTLMATDWTHDAETWTIGLWVLNKMREMTILTRTADNDPTTETTPERPRLTVTLGADPEFEAFVDGVIVSAGRYTPGVGEGIELGNDGGSSETLEIRPRPSTTPEGLVAELKRIMTRAKDHYSDLGVRGDRYSLGGHIHLGGCPVDSQVLTMLDDFLGKPMRVLNGASRQRMGYGHLSDSRQQNWGIEYRTIPSAWCHDPETARIVLKVAKGVAETWLNENTITYNDPVQNGDYEQLCGLTSEEVVHLRGFLGNRDVTRPGIFSAWGLITRPSTPPTPRFHIQFSDDWIPQNREFIEEIITRRIRCEKDVNIRLFGLADHRGNSTAGFSASGYERVAMRQCDTDAIFGIPYWVRMTESGRQQTINRPIVAALRKELKRLAKGEPRETWSPPPVPQPEPVVTEGNEQPTEGLRALFG